jgi:hypothetical protein
VIDLWGPWQGQALMMLLGPLLLQLRLEEQSL